MSTSDPHAPESHAATLAAELREADRWISAENAYYDKQPVSDKADIRAGSREKWETP